MCIYILYIAYTYITAYFTDDAQTFCFSLYCLQLGKYAVAILLYFRRCCWYNKCSKHMLLLSCSFSDTVTDITNVLNICCCFIRLCYKKTTHWQKHKLLLSCCLGFATVTMLLLGLLFYHTLLLLIQDINKFDHKLLYCFFWVVNTKQIFNHKWDLKTAVTSCQYFYLASSVATEQRRGMAIRRSCSGAGGNWQWAMLDAVMLRGA